MNKEQQLYDAIENKNYAECKQILTESKQNILNKDFKQKYPLCLACENNHYELVELFLEVNRVYFTIY